MSKSCLRFLLIIMSLSIIIGCSARSNSKDIVSSNSKDNVSLNIDFFALPCEAEVSQPVKFTLTSTGNIKSCYWDFGDGESSYELNPIHLYKKAGKYTVILVVNGINEMDVKKKIDYISIFDSEKPVVLAEVISWLNAGKYIGQHKTVEGTIVDTYFGVNIKGQPTFLNFYKPYKDFFKCLIWGSDRAKFIGMFPPNPETYLLNKTVQVTGLIEEYPERSGIPEIILRDPSQVRVILGK